VSAYTTYSVALRSLIGMDRNFSIRDVRDIKRLYLSGELCFFGFVIAK
jgi:hypothetical protein